MTRKLLAADTSEVAKIQDTLISAMRGITEKTLGKIRGRFDTMRTEYSDFMSHWDDFFDYVMSKVPKEKKKDFEYALNAILRKSSVLDAWNAAFDRSGARADKSVEAAWPKVSPEMKDIIDNIDRIGYDIKDMYKKVSMHMQDDLDAVKYVLSKNEDLADEFKKHFNDRQFKIAADYVDDLEMLLKSMDTVFNKNLLQG